MNGTADRRIEQLRPMELLCYQVAFYLLGESHAAAQACENALLRLYQEPRWEMLGSEERTQLARRAAIDCALQARIGAHKQEQDQGRLLPL